MRTSIIKSWNLPRAFRLAFGIVASIQGIVENEFMLLIAGGLIAAMAVFNVGCCGAGGCAIPQNKKTEA